MEAIGQFPGQSDAYDEWRGTTPVSHQYRRQGEPQWRLQTSGREEDTPGPQTAVAERETVTSPPLASYSALLQNGFEFELRPSFGSPPGLSSNAKPDGNPSNLQDLQAAMELASFSLDQNNKMPAGNISNATPPQLGVNIMPKSPERPGPQCRNIWSSDDDLVATSEEPKNRRGCSTIGATPYEDDRGFRKKSREKMRRHEVNDKFELLVDLLGFPNRARKKVVLNEAVTTIKTLRRECNELRRDRERLHYECNWLRTYRAHQQPQLACLEGASQ